MGRTIQGKMEKIAIPDPSLELRGIVSKQHGAEADLVRQLLGKKNQHTRIVTQRKIWQLCGNITMPMYCIFEHNIGSSNKEQ